MASRSNRCGTTPCGNDSCCCHSSGIDAAFSSIASLPNHVRAARVDQWLGPEISETSGSVKKNTSGSSRVAGDSSEALIMRPLAMMAVHNSESHWECGSRQAGTAFQGLVGKASPAAASNCVNETLIPSSEFNIPRSTDLQELSHGTPRCHATFSHETDHACLELHVGRSNTYIDHFLTKQEKNQQYLC